MKLLSGKTNGLFIRTMAFLFLLTLFGNMFTWSLGVNNVASYAADNHDLPRIFAKRSVKKDMPIGSAIMSGVVATMVVLLGNFFPYSDLFWCFFALNVVMTLLSYLPVFPAFLRLRKLDPEHERPFKVPGGPVMRKTLAVVPMILLIISLIFTVIPMPLDAKTLSEKLPITIGSVIALIVGEVVVNACKKNQSVFEKFFYRQYCYRRSIRESSLFGSHGFNNRIIVGEEKRDGHKSNGDI